MNSESIKQLNELLNNYKELLNIQKHPSVMIVGDKNITDIIRLVEEQIKSYCEHLKTKEEIKKVDNEESKNLDELQKLCNIISQKYNIELYEQRFKMDDNDIGIKFIQRLPLSNEDIKYLRKHIGQLDLLLRHHKM